MNDTDSDFIFKAQKGIAALAHLQEITYEYNARILVYQHDKLKLYHYQPLTQPLHSVPLLLVFATVNRPEILDLFPDRSFIRYLLLQGMDVYLLDWGYPDQVDQQITMQDYIMRYLHGSVNFICETHQLTKINLLGICQGGLLSLCYAALTEQIKKLILISCPIDFHQKNNVISQIFQKINVEKVINLNGNIPGWWLTQFFISLRPFELVGKKYLHYVDEIKQIQKTADFLRVEKWLYDAPDQTAASFKELITYFYQENQLIRGEFYLGTQKIDLTKLNIPVLNIMAKNDNIVPMSASRCLKKLIKPELYKQLIYPSGHIGLYISRKVGAMLPAAIAKWIKD